jgi:hypothetical protein
MTDTWTIDELKALTNTVSSDVVNYRRKELPIQWCELIESEEPRMVLPADDVSEEEKTEAYQEIGYTKVLAMLKKADEMNPDDACGIASAWEDLPATLRYAISTKVLGGEIPDF